MSKRNIKLIVISIFSVILFGAGVIINSSVKTYTTEVMRIKKEIRNINKEIKTKEKENNSIEVKKLQEKNQEIQKNIDTIVNQNKQLQATIETTNKAAIDVKGSKWVGSYNFESLRGSKRTFRGYAENLNGKLSIEFNEHDTNLKFEDAEDTILNIIGPTAKVNGEFGYIKLEDSKSMNYFEDEEYKNRDYEVHITINNDKLTGIIVDETVYSSQYYVVGSFEATKVN